MTLKEINFIGTDLFANVMFIKNEVPYLYRSVGKDTNTEKPAIEPKNLEDKLLWARNKWLIAHPDSSEAKQGAFVGLTGINIDLA